MENLNEKAWASQLNQDDNAIVLDVRTDEEINEGIIKNAIHADIQNPQEFMTILERLDKEKSYYVYCRSGKRSQMACEIMKQSGFKTTYNLDGGISSWTGEIVSLQ